MRVCSVPRLNQAPPAPSNTPTCRTSVQTRDPITLSKSVMGSYYVRGTNPVDVLLTGLGNGRCLTVTKGPTAAPSIGVIQQTMLPGGNTLWLTQDGVETCFGSEIVATTSPKLIAMAPTTRQRLMRAAAGVALVGQLVSVPLSKGECIALASILATDADGAAPYPLCPDSAINAPARCRNCEGAVLCSRGPTGCCFWC
jgi:hypothetical protein